MTIEIRTVGIKQNFVIVDNGVDIFVENFNEAHPFWDFDWNNIGIFEQQAIQNRTGYKPPLSGILQKLSQAKTYVDNIVENKKPEFKASDSGQVTQLTSKATAVTINTLIGRITTMNSALAAAAEVTFTVNNNLVGANDFPMVALKGGGTIGAYDVQRTSSQAGSFTITIGNKSTGSLSQAIIIDFWILKLV